MVTRLPRLTPRGGLSTSVTRPVILEVTIIKIGTNPRTGLPTVGFDAMTTVKRSDFGLGGYVPQVSDEIQMHIISQAVETKPYEAYLKTEEKKSHH